jgi:hypothetical protein
MAALRENVTAVTDVSISPESDQERRLSRNRRCCHRQLCRPEFPRADHRGLGGDAAPLDFLGVVQIRAARS